MIIIYLYYNVLGKLHSTVLTELDTLSWEGVLKVHWWESISHQLRKHDKR